MIPPPILTILLTVLLALLTAVLMFLTTELTADLVTLIHLLTVSLVGAAVGNCRPVQVQRERRRLTRVGPDTAAGGGRGPDGGRGG